MAWLAVQPEPAHAVPQKQKAEHCEGEREEGQADVLLHKDGQGQQNSAADGRPKPSRCGLGLARNSFGQQKNQQEQQHAVAVVEGQGENAVNAQEAERRGQQKGGQPGVRHCAQPALHNPPCEQRGQSSRHGRIEGVQQKVAPEEVDDGGLQQKGHGSMSQWEVPIRELPLRDAPTGVECITQIPKHNVMRVLPQHNGKGGGKEQQGRQPFQALGRHSQGLGQISEACHARLSSIFIVLSGQCKKALHRLRVSSLESGVRLIVTP